MILLLSSFFNLIEKFPRKKLKFVDLLFYAKVSPVQSWPYRHY